MRGSDFEGTNVYRTKIQEFEFHGSTFPIHSSKIFVRSITRIECQLEIFMRVGEIRNGVTLRHLDNMCQQLSPPKGIVLVFSLVEANDLSFHQFDQTCIGTISIIEKGIWNDLFPLEGGGHVHMRLQFILSMEERNRIRKVRESAVKKKRSASTIGRSQSLSSINNEVSDSQAIVVHNAVAASGDLAAGSSKEEKEGTSRALLIPNATDTSEELPSTSLMKKLETHFPSAQISLQKSSSTSVFSEPVSSSMEKSCSPDLKHKPLEKIPSNGNKLSQGVEVHDHNVQVGPTMQREASPVLGFSKPVVAAKTKSVFLKMDSSPSNKPKKRESLEKTHSSVKKMISAFESVPSQDTRILLKPPAEKSQPNKVVMKVPLKDHEFKDSTFPLGSSSKILKNPFALEDSPQNPLKIMKTVHHNDFGKDINSNIESKTNIQSRELRTLYPGSKGAYDVIENNSKEAHVETNTEEPLKSLKRSYDQDFVERSVKEGRGNRRFSNNSHDDNVESITGDQDFSERSVTEKSGNESFSNSSHDDNLESTSCFENEGNSYEYCSTVLFANDRRRLCLTTGGKEVMDLLGCLCIEGKSTHEGKDLISIPEDEGKCGTEAEVKSEKIAAHHIFRKSKSEKLGNDSSSGALGQMMKIAIIVGFGLLVLLTTQGEPNRKSKRKGNENLSTTPYRMDQRSLSDEEWM